MGYITTFIVYTLAMVGVIVVALLVFKNATTIGGGRSSKYLKIIDTISIGQRKNLYIVSTGREQFLIAGDVNNTSLISKLNLNGSADTESDSTISDKALNSNNMQELHISNSRDTHSFQDTLSALNNKKRYTDNKTSIGIKSSLITEKRGESSSVIQNWAEILKN